MIKVIKTVLLTTAILTATVSCVANKSSFTKGTIATSDNSYTPGLGEIMTAIQSRHAKLWFAGAANNWKLADYELYELNEGFEDALKFHPKRAKLLEKMTEASTEQLKVAINHSNQTEFNSAFKAATNACNSCHQATGFEFIKVIVPETNPFPNQGFEQ
jgi:hypothetical protein